MRFRTRCKTRFWKQSLVRGWMAVPLLLVAGVPALAQKNHGSARDTFWSASDLVTVTPNPASHRVAKARPPKAGSGPESSGDLAMNQSPATGADGASAPGSTTNHAVPAVLLASENGYGAAPHLVHTTESRLGLRYSILRRDPEGVYSEVVPGTVFHSGEHIKLSLMANEPGYLYVIEKGSSGSWSPIFPGAGGSAAHIDQGRLQEVPDGTKSFLFDQNPGDEKLFVILSRTPITDLDRRIANLRGSQPAPALQPPSGEQMAPVVEAENHIPDLFVQQLAARDLTLVDEEKVDQAPTASHGGEKAVYVVSKASAPQGAGAGGEIVAGIDLRHE